MYYIVPREFTLDQINAELKQSEIEKNSLYLKMDDEKKNIVNGLCLLIKEEIISFAKFSIQSNNELVLRNPENAKRAKEQVMEFAENAEGLLASQLNKLECLDPRSLDISNGYIRPDMAIRNPIAKTISSIKSEIGNILYSQGLIRKEDTTWRRNYATNRIEQTSFEPLYGEKSKLVDRYSQYAEQLVNICEKIDSLNKRKRELEAVNLWDNI